MAVAARATAAAARATATAAAARAAAVRATVVRVVAGTETRCRPCTPPGSRLRTLWRREPCQRTRCKRRRGSGCPPESSGTPSAGRCC
eukprot:scaffold116385_cov47-Phaeocystis_antarctica.AAC.1